MRQAARSGYHLIVQLFHLIWQTKIRVNISVSNIENWCLFSLTSPCIICLFIIN